MVYAADEMHQRVGSKGGQSGLRLLVSKSRPVYVVNEEVEVLTNSLKLSSDTINLKGSSFNI